MKNIFLCFIVIYILFAIKLPAQEIPVTSQGEQLLEDLTTNTETENEDDSQLQSLLRFRKSPLNINKASKEDLQELYLLSDLQIDNLISYRRLFGNLVSLYELQSVPSWNLQTINLLLPYISVKNERVSKEDISGWLSKGEHSLLLRYSRVLESSSGFNSGTGSKYEGSPDKLFARYRYQFRNTFQFGITGDKDAGEAWFNRSQKKGFDFYSFHLFAKNMGIIKSLAIGDFTVNMGQGLIHWQTLSFKKSVNITGVKRQSPVLKPYTSSGEFNFMRGAGVTITKRHFDLTVFGSIRSLSAVVSFDSVSGKRYTSSVLGSGYHRTPSEIENKSSLRQLVFGGSLQFSKGNFHAGINSVGYHYNLPLIKEDLPYNLYSSRASSFYFCGVDYSYTYRNLHFFGETAVDKNRHPAVLHGLLISVDPKADITLLYRNIAKDYKSDYGNAFTENTLPAAEKGLYAGISIRPSEGWQLDAYFDLFAFPWLKYQVDAPSSGKEYFIQLSYKYQKKAEIYSRFRVVTKQANQVGNNTPTNYLVATPGQNWRIQGNYRLPGNWILRNRLELLWYDKKGKSPETGFLIYSDLMYQPGQKPVSAGLRLQYFETSGYNSRIYAYENDVLYFFSIPAFYEKGFRYYLNLNFTISRQISLWIKLAQTLYPEKQSVGTGLDEIEKNRKSEIRLQLRIMF